MRPWATSWPRSTASLAAAWAPPGAGPWNTRTSEKTKVLVPDGSIPARLGNKENRSPRFSRRTRTYLCRRAFRYFRALARKDAARYGHAIRAALLLYRDANLELRSSSTPGAWSTPSTGARPSSIATRAAPASPRAAPSPSSSPRPSPKQASGGPSRRRARPRRPGAEPHGPRLRHRPAPPRPRRGPARDLPSPRPPLPALAARRGPGLRRRAAPARERGAQPQHRGVAGAAPHRQPHGPPAALRFGGEDGLARPPLPRPVRGARGPAPGPRRRARPPLDEGEADRRRGRAHDRARPVPRRRAGGARRRLRLARRADREGPLRRARARPHPG